MGGGEEEEDGRFFVGDRSLGRELLGEGVVPGESYADFREAQLEELELAKVFV
jgi:hypothetical protein